MIVPDWAGYLVFRDAFAEVLDNRFHTISWLDQQVLGGEFQFWRSADAAIIAEIRTYPTGARELHGLLAAGELPEIVSELIPIAEQWGREQGCMSAVIESRPGWGRALTDYETYQIAIRKDL